MIGHPQVLLSGSQTPEQHGLIIPRISDKQSDAGQTLADPGLIRTDDGHKYVLSRVPDGVEQAALVAEIETAETPEFAEAQVSYGGSEEVVRVRGLTTGNRPAVQTALEKCLNGTNKARAVAGAAAGKGAIWAETQAETNAQAEAAVRESFERLPDEHWRNRRSAPGGRGATIRPRAPAAA